MGLGVAFRDPLLGLRGLGGENENGLTTACITAGDGASLQGTASGGAQRSEFPSWPCPGLQPSADHGQKQNCLARGQ